MDLAIYLHFPFCKQKCFYCDFNSYSGRDALMPEYCEALLTEMARNLPQRHRIASIYFGGGTPSLFPVELLVRILGVLQTNFQTTSRTEITIEANPGTLTVEALLQLKDAGFNRLSLGLQATQNDLLQNIGRIHRYQEFENLFYLAREIGFTNINVDLMFGLPGQTRSAWEETLARVVALEPHHISAYGLQLEKDTRLYQKIVQGELQLPDEEETVAMMRTAMRFLPENHYEHYEISNYALPGYQSRHNLAYWQGRDYLGCGAGATSTIYGERRTNVKDPEEYINRIKNGKTAAATSEAIDHRTAALEALMLGLRMRGGVDLLQFKELWGIDLEAKMGERIGTLIGQDFLKITNRHLRLTDAGVMVSNEVISCLLKDW